MRRPLPFLALAALLAGCGSTAKNTSSTGGSVPAGASVVRAGVLAFVSADSDLGSGQWQQLDKLAQKFPGRDQAVAKLKQQLSQQGVDYEQDVKPALGPELDFAVVSAGAQSSPRSSRSTKPDDPAKFKALVAKLNAKDSSGQRAVYREVDGWYALSDSQAAITQALEGNGPLADDPAFKEAMAQAPGRRAREGLRRRAAPERLVSRAAAQNSSGFDSSSLGLDKLKYVAASASAEDNGLRIQRRLERRPRPAPATSPPS